MRQHFVAHLLLSKMLVGSDRSKMCWALHRLTFSKAQDNTRIFKSSEYEIARKIHITNISKPKSVEHQLKISKALSGQKRSLEQKERISQAIRLERANNLNNPNRIRTKEQQEKASAKLRNVPKSKEHIAKLKGPKSEEHRKKLGLAQTGKVVSAETRAKLSAIGKGRKCKPRSPEHLAAIWASRRANAILKEQKVQSLMPQDLFPYQLQKPIDIDIEQLTQSLDSHSY